MKRIKSILQFLDQFGEPIEFNIKREYRSKTSFGGILTIVAAILILAVTFATGFELIYKENPEVNIEDQVFMERPQMYLNKHTMPISFCFQDMSQQTYDLPKYFKFEVLGLKVFSANGTTIAKNYEYEKCTFDHFPNIPIDYLTKSGIVNYYCLKDQNITLKGFFDNEYIEFATISLKRCNNETDGYMCA
jgi:hypothetical protein